MFGTYQRLNVPVWASDQTIIRAARKKLAEHCVDDPRYRVDRHEFYCRMLEYHHRTQELCRELRL